MQKRQIGNCPGLFKKWTSNDYRDATAGCSQKDVAEHFFVHPFTICWLLNWFRTTWHVSNCQRSERPRQTTVRQNCFTVTTSRHNRFVAVSKVADELRRASGLRLCGQSVKKKTQLGLANLRARKPLTTVPLTHRHRQSRLAWGMLARHPCCPSSEWS